MQHMAGLYPMRTVFERLLLAHSRHPQQQVSAVSEERTLLIS